MCTRLRSKSAPPTYLTDTATTREEPSGSTLLRVVVDSVKLLQYNNT